MKSLYNKIKTISTIIIIIFITTSCEKVIDIDLNSASKKYVIEGEVSSNPSIAAQVKLSQTKNFSDDNSFNGVSGATVTITEYIGTVDIIHNLTETSTGLYSNTSLVGKYGSTYKLNIQVNGNTFTASSTMPGYVNLDTITSEKTSFGGDNTITISPSYIDPIGLGNSYRFIEYRNNKLVKNVFVQNDAISDGKTTTRPLLVRNGELESGDSIKVIMQCIDENVYNYWYSLTQAATGNSQATPANPISNIIGGAIGVFSANTYSTKSIKIP
jgi:hypothetical protein